MQRLIQDMKTGQLNHLYLLYGEEAYLRKQYRDKLKEAIIGDDSMNYHYYEGKDVSIGEVIDQAEYAKRYDGLNDRYNTTREKIDALEKKKAARLGEADKIGAFMFEMLERDEPLDTFDERLWIAVIDHATVYHDGRIVFTFVNGMEVEG